MADIAKGETFADGEQLTGARLNNLLDSAVINTAFHTAKSSAGSNPSTSATEVMVYDSGASSFKRSTLGALVFDHTSLLSARSAKTVPVAADLLLLADSAASNAYKSISLANLLFGAAAHSAPIGDDSIAIYDSANSAVKKIALSDLSTLLPAHTAPVNADKLMIYDSADGELNNITLGALINGATAATVPIAADTIPIYNGSAYKKVALSTLISGIGTALVAPAGTELLQVLDSTTLKKITFANLQAYAQTGVNRQYILVREDQTAGTDAGTFTTGAWRTRSMNTEHIDVGSNATVAANQITLSAGTYEFRISAPGYKCNLHQCRLYNATSAAAVGVGTVVRSAAGDDTVARSEAVGRFVIAAPTVFEVQHICSTTRASDGFGPAGNLDTEVYAVAEFWKIA